MNNIEKIPSESVLIPDALKGQICALFVKLTKNISLKAILDYEDEKSMELLKRMFTGVSEEQLRVTIQTIIQIEDNLKAI